MNIGNRLLQPGFLGINMGRIFIAFQDTKKKIKLHLIVACKIIFYII